MFSVERLYDNIALLIDQEGQPLHIDRGLLPADTREGDLLARTDEGYWIDREATAAKRRQNFLRLQRLAQKDGVDQSE